MTVNDLIDQLKAMKDQNEHGGQMRVGFTVLGRVAEVTGVQCCHAYFGALILPNPLPPPTKYVHLTSSQLIG